jgi:hypothetical protein
MLQRYLNILLLDMAVTSLINSSCNAHVQAVYVPGESQ